jgi:peptide/nickel transport system substrate-binding protein
MRRIRCFGGSVILLLAVGCAPTSALPPSDPTDGRDARPPAAARTLTLAQINAVPMYGPWEFSNTSGGGATFAEIHTQGLTTQGSQGQITARLAARLPSFDDGTIVVLPDGRMQTTWRLRSDVTWHDGAPLTAADLVFSQAVHVEFPSSINGFAPHIERIDTPDPHTALITWKTTYSLALDFHHRNMWLFPKHRLSEAFESEKAELLANPYFTTEYIQLGPFRLVEWGLGENQVFERYDGFFLGRPRVDRIIIRSIADPTTVLTNLKAGAIDLSAEKTLLTDAYSDLRDEWARSSEGTLLQRQENWRYIWFQFDPQWARPIEMSQDVRIRRGLAYGWDRESLRQLILGEFDQRLTSADTFMEAIDPRGEVVGKPFARYTYDPARAVQELADAGWRRSADGKLLNAAGQQVQLETRGNPPDVKELAVIADYWRNLGIDVTEFIPPPALGRDNEYKSKFPSVETRARGNGEGIFSSFVGRDGAGPHNRWQGANSAHYNNPTYDRLYDRLLSTLNPTEHTQVIKDLGELLASDLPALPMYFRISFMSVRSTVRGPIFEDFPNTRGSGGSISRNAHLWDRV